MNNELAKKVKQKFLNEEFIHKNLEDVFLILKNLSEKVEDG